MTFPYTLCLAENELILSLIKNKASEEGCACIVCSYSYFPLSGIGCVVTTINPAYTASEVARQLIMSKTKKILTLPKSVKLVEEAISTLKGERGISLCLFYKQTFFTSTIVTNTEAIHFIRAFPF
jgi:hypothetical protein